MGGTIKVGTRGSRLALIQTELVVERLRAADPDTRCEIVIIHTQSDRDQQVGSLKLQDEARLRLDEVRILVASGERLDRNPIAADLPADGGEILGSRDDIELALRRHNAGDERRAQDER